MAQEFTQPVMEMSTSSYPGVKGWQLHCHLWADCLQNVGSLTSHGPMGHYVQLQGWLYPFLPMSRFVDNSNYSSSSCLQSWLEQDTSCPTCRMILSTQSPAGLGAANRLDHNLLAGENQVDNQTTNRRPPNHFFHFDGNYCSGTFTATDNYIFIYFYTYLYLGIVIFNSFLHSLCIFSIICLVLV
jgi:hypothetical protein